MVVMKHLVPERGDLIWSALGYNLKNHISTKLAIYWRQCSQLLSSSKQRVDFTGKVGQVKFWQHTVTLTLEYWLSFNLSPVCTGVYISTQTLFNVHRLNSREKNACFIGTDYLSFSHNYHDNLNVLPKFSSHSLKSE